MIAAGVAFVVAVGAIAVIGEQVSPGRSDTATMAGVLPVEHWQQRFDADADTRYERSLDEGESAGSWDYLREVVRAASAPR